MAMLSYRLRRVLFAVPSCLQRSFSLSSTSDFSFVASLLPRLAVKQSAKFGRSPARLFSTTQYQYDPYTGQDSFTPDDEGCDFNHWLITINFPKENPPSRDEMISIFEQTCAEGLDISLEEAKKRIYAICTTSYQGFQATMTVREVEKFRDFSGIQYIVPDSYVDVENKVYGGDKYENGVVTPGPVPVPTRDVFNSLLKESSPGQEQAQKSQATSAQVKEQGSQSPLDQRSFKQGRETLVTRQGKGQGSRMSISRQELGRGQGRQMPTLQRSYNQCQGTPIHGQGQWQGQGSQIPSDQMDYYQGQGAQMPPCQGLPSNYGQIALVNYNQEPPPAKFQQGTQENYKYIVQGNYNYGSAQGTGSPGPPGFGHGYYGHEQGCGGPLLSPYEGSYNQSHGTPIPEGQGSQIPSYQMGYSQGLGATLPPYQGNYNQGTPYSCGQLAPVNYNQGQQHDNFVQGPQQNYNQGGQWNFNPQNGGHYGNAQFGEGYPGDGCGQGNYMPRYQLAPVNYNQGQQYDNFLQGPQQNYNKGGQWNFNPQNGGHYGHAQFGEGYPGDGYGQGNYMPQYQLSYNHGQGAPFPGQRHCQGCGMPLSYQGSNN